MALHVSRLRQEVLQVSPSLRPAACSGTGLVGLSDILRRTLWASYPLQCAVCEKTQNGDGLPGKEV